MLNNCSHEKIGYLLDKSGIQEVCNTCFDIECVESHKFFLKSELQSFSQKIIPHLNEFVQLLFDQIPTQIESLYEKLKKQQKKMAEESPKKNLQHTIEILQNKNDKHLRSLLELYVTRGQIQVIEEKLTEVRNFNSHIQKCLEIFPLVQVSTQLSIKEKKQKQKNPKIVILQKQKQTEVNTEIQQFQNEENHVEQIQDPLSQEKISDGPKIQSNDEVVQYTQNFEIPPQTKISRLYSATWLNENLIGLASGEYHPFIIYDWSTKKIHQEICQEKNGVYDSILINQKLIALAYVYTVKLFDFLNGKFIQNPLEFEAAQSYFSKLYFCQANNSIFTSNLLSQLSDVNYINQWSILTGKLQKYKFSGKTYGPLCLVPDKNQLCFSLWKEQNSRGTRKNFLQIWNFGEQNYNKQIVTKDPMHALLIFQNELYGFGTDVTIWNIQNWKVSYKVSLPEKHLIPQLSYSIQELLLIGFINGEIWTLQNKNWTKLFRQGGKLMKIDEKNGKFLLTSLECNFMIFSLKN